MPNPSAHILDRRHREPVLPAHLLNLGDRFLDQSTGRYVTFDGQLPDHVDPWSLVNLEANR